MKTITDKPLSEQHALQKLTALCARGEHCTQEMLDKMQRWGLDEEARTRNMAYLTEHKYVDDERFARFFINDKIKYNHWGRRKVEQALWLKRIPKDISDPIFEELGDENFLEALRPVIHRKWETTKAATDYERSMKVIKYALSRGFGFDLIRKCIDELSDADLDMTEDNF